MYLNEFRQPKAFSIWRLYLLLAIIHCGIALIIPLRTTSEPESIIFIGLSMTRLIMEVGIFLSMLFFGLMLLMSWRNPKWFSRLIDRVHSLLERPRVWGSLTVLSILGLLLGGYFITLTPDITESFTQAYFERLEPLTILMLGISAQTLIVLLLLRYGFDLPELRSKGKTFYITIAIFGLIFVAWIWVARTQLEDETIIKGWNIQGIPILETQVFLALTAGLMMLLVILLMQQGSSKYRWITWLKPGKPDFIIGLLIWLGTIILWTNIPVTPTWFVSEKRSPNYEYYPNSDALSYDLSAQILLAGEGLQFDGTPFVRRPMHTVFITALHTIGGQNYGTIVNLQIIVLATLPVAIYLLAKTLHNQMSGVIAAVLISLREANSIAIASTVTASHAKLLLADLPATLGTVWFMYVTILWLQQIERKQLYPLVAGGILGITTLIRPELGFLIFAVGLITFLLLRKRLRLWLKSMSLFMLGVVLIITPWVWRNWSNTGLVFLDSPSFRFELLEERYKELDITPNPQSEVDTPIPQPTVTSPVISEQAPPEAPLPHLGYVANVIQQITDFARKNTTQVASFVSSHYLNSQTQIFLILPTSYRAFDSIIGFLGHKSPDRLWFECCSLLGYVRRLPYWHKWNGVFPSQTIIPLVVNLFVIAVGIREAWKRHKLIGLSPIIISIIHLLVNAVFRNSGGRYILPVDWVGVLYYSFGLAQISLWAIFLVTHYRIKLDLDRISNYMETPASDSHKSILRSSKFYALAMGLFLIGSIPPVIEKSIPPVYNEEIKTEMLNTLLQSTLLSGSERLSLNSFLEGNGVVSAGRALYPRYYREDQGEPGTNNPMGPRPFSRLGFYIVGPENQPVVMSLNEPPAYFPNNSNVLVFSCPGAETQVLATAIFNSSKSPTAFLIRSPRPANYSCPLETSIEGQ